MVPEVQKTIDALNIARQWNQTRIDSAKGFIDEAEESVNAANEMLKLALDENEKLNALLATLFHQVGDLVPPTPAADPNKMPVETLAGWKLIKGEDFLTPVALGGALDHFKPKGWAFYDGGVKDTSKKGTYDTNLTVSVADSVLTAKYTHKAGVPCGTAMLPLGWGGQLYGRFAVRFRADEVAQRKLAWLLWPPNDDWTKGEIDFPEASAGGTIFGFNHKLGPMPNPQTNQMWVDTGVKTTDWHTTVIEWRPERLTFILDGKVVKETTDKAAIPSTPMRWVLQNETSLTDVPVPADSKGNVQIAWLTAHAIA